MIYGLIKQFFRFKSQKMLRFEEGIDYNKIFANPLKAKGASLYVHIPFCMTKCEYCTFLKFDYDKPACDSYYVLLKKELDTYVDKGFVFSQAYIGGGTPTINMAKLVEFISYLKKKTGIKLISVETILSDVNEKNLKALKKSGVTRLSVGIQSFNDDKQKKLGRKEVTKDEIIKKIGLAKKYIGTVNADIIFNLENQSVKEFESELDFFIKLGDLQATFYPLIPSDSENSGFNKISITHEKRFYGLLSKKMEENKYSHFTVWCFSKDKKMTDEYITKSDDYVGIGCGSISMVNNLLYINSFSLEKYAGLIKTRGIGTVMFKESGEKDLAQYYMLIKLFGTELDKKGFKKKFGKDINDLLRFELLGLKTLGWIMEDEKSIRLTPKGMYPFSFMMREFFSNVSGLRQKSIKKEL